MRRTPHHRLWTLVLLLVLSGSAGVSVLPPAVWADIMPDAQDPPPPPIPQAGDPDFPTLTGRSPKPGPAHGTSQQVRRGDIASPGSLGGWMWKFRTAFAAVYRVFFRF